MSNPPYAKRSKAAFALYKRLESTGNPLTERWFYLADEVDAKIAEMQAEIYELKNMIATLQFWYDLSDDHEDAVDALIAKHKQEKE